MARYSFKIGTPTGSIQTYEADGESFEEARRSLEAKGYFVFDGGSQPKGQTWKLPRIPNISLDRIRPRTVLVFNQELLALVKAGLPIIVTLDLLRERIQQPRLRAILGEVREDVKGGAALSAAMAKHSGVFTALYTAALHAGEVSGNFVDALSRYVVYQQRILALRQRFRAALTYPAILCVASLAVITFLLTYVVPTFTKIYGDMDKELPTPTRLLVAFTGQLQGSLPLLAVGIPLVVLAIWRWRKTPAGRLMMDRGIMRLPFLGSIVDGYLFSRLARTLAMMLGGGIPMIPSLETAMTIVGNAYLTRGLREAIPQVAAGNSLATALEASGVVPPLMLELVGVGEKSGSLVDMLGHIAELYDGEVDSRLATLAATIEPAVMVVMGGIVAAIVIIMYLPIFNLAGAVH
jgi:type IV pilus assembly protein PilC